MRATIAAAFLFLALSSAAFAQEVEPVDTAAVVSACVANVALPAGRTAEPTAIAAYCQCAIDRAEVAQTPAEFAIFKRMTLLHAGAGAPLTEDERAAIAALDPAGFDRTQRALRAVIAAQCAPILFGPRETTMD